MHLLQDPPSFGGGGGREVASLKPNHRPFRSLLYGLGVGRGTERGIIQKANGEAVSGADEARVLLDSELLPGFLGEDTSNESGRQGSVSTKPALSPRALILVISRWVASSPKLSCLASR